jgi:hypothetical protein
MYDMYCSNLSYRKTKAQSLFRSLAAVNLCSSCWSKSLSVKCSKECRPNILSGDNINPAAVVLHVAPEIAPSAVVLCVA